MLGRNSSSRSSRRKSTSSAHSKHEPIDPEVARQHAQAAATLAFARAQNRNGADVGHRGSRLSRQTTSDNRGRHHPSQQNSSDSQTDLVIRRQHSVRFAGPNAVERRQSISSRVPQVQHEVSNRTLRPIAMTTNAPVPAVYRPPSRSSSLGKASTGRGAAESYVTAVQAYNEYYTSEDDVASTPSSYRRIRKSKSMFGPLKAPSVFYTNGTPESPRSPSLWPGHSISNIQTPQSKAYQNGLRAPRSMAFLGGIREDRDRNDAAVQLARDRFFNEANQQRLREQPSFLFRSKAQRQERPFRKSVRSGSTNSYGLPVTSSNQATPSKEPTIKDRARKASQGIKNKLMRVFGRSKETVEIPSQQVCSRETHVREYLSDGHNSFENIPRPCEATLSRVASRPPSLRTAGSNQRLRSYAGSVKSTKSDHAGENSRVTSWNSTGVNTIASQAARLQSERELQRLSIINENGAHVPSSSFNHSRASQFPIPPPHHKPSMSAGPMPSIAPPPVDSARVYSALMKRLDEKSPKTKLEASREASVENFSAAKIPRRRSSVCSTRTLATIRKVTPSECLGSETSNSSQPTSQHDHQWVKADYVSSARAENVFGCTGPHVHQWVKADYVSSARAENVFGCTGPHVHQWVAADCFRGGGTNDEDDVFSPAKTSHNEQTSTKGEPQINRNSLVSNTAISRQASTKASFYTVPENQGMTPQELAYCNEPVVQGKRILHEARSTFFGGTSHAILRTTSPFRRALAENDYNSTVLTDESLPVNHVLRPNSLYLPPQISVHPYTGIANTNEPTAAYSESVYSRTTSGVTPAAGNSALSLPLQDREVPEMPPLNRATGDAVIIDRSTYRPAMPATRGHRATNSASSTEWKTWMSSEVAKLEKGKDNANSSSSYVNYALPTMPRFFNGGHVRENAQIDDDDRQVAQNRVVAVKQPLGILQKSMNAPNIQTISQQNTPLLKPILKNKSVTSLIENVDLNMSSISNIPIPPPPPPPIPPRSPLRPTQSKSSLRSINTINTVRTGSAPNSALKIPSLSGKNVLHKRNASNATFKTVGSVDTPAKLVKRGKKAAYSDHASSPVGWNSTNPRTPATVPRLQKINHENANPSGSESDDIYGSEGAGLMGPMTQNMEVDAQQMGSRRMVDLFLSSRRRRIAGGSEESNNMFL
jgi:hypothetical protein